MPEWLTWKECKLHEAIVLRTAGQGSNLIQVSLLLVIPSLSCLCWVSLVVTIINKRGNAQKPLNYSYPRSKLISCDISWVYLESISNIFHLNILNQRL